MNKMFVVGGIAALALSTVSFSVAQAGAEAKCKACHSFENKNMTGPGLAGVYGRKAGTVEGFQYSDAVKSGKWSWDDEHLKAFLEDSNAAVQKFTGDAGAKSKMPPQKLTGEKADEVINFLKGLK